MVAAQSSRPPEGGRRPGRARAVARRRAERSSPEPERTLTLAELGPHRIARSLRHRGRLARRRLWRALTRLVRRALIRYASAPPPGQAEGERQVTILLFSAWGMGGTIRTTLNLAAYLAERHEVEIVSVMRRRKSPFFGKFPPGVKVTALDDRRPQAAPDGLEGLARRVLRRVPSVLVHPNERWAEHFTLWTDIGLARRLRRRSGILIATRPGLNLIAAELAPPGMITIGEEHMPLRHHPRALRKAMWRLYPKLDAFAVLTEETRQEYARVLDGQVRLARIPNAVRELGGPTADIEAKTILAAGRLVPQKGFDYLVPAFAQVAAVRPDWRLRICGHGPRREELEQMIEHHGLGGAVTLAPPTKDIASELEQASIFALSSREEGFPLMLLEAMSKGMAVVSFDCPTGPADLIDDHRNGILVPPKDPDALAAGLLEMIADDELRRRCAAAAVTTARGYRMESIGPLWDDLFDELEDRRASRRRPAMPEPQALKTG